MVQSLILNAKILSEICYHSGLILYGFKIVFCQPVKWETDMGFGFVAKLEKEEN